MNRPRLLITRAQPEATSSAVWVTRLGGDPIVAPIRTALGISSPAPSRPAAFVATSARAFHLGAPIPADWHDLPCLVVGEVTGEAAREAGFRDIRAALGDVASLAPLLADFRARPIVYLAGEPRRPELEADAEKLGVHLVPWLRYRLEDAQKLPDAARSALAQGDCDAILHFSRESTLSLLRLAQAAGLQRTLGRPLHACLSPAIAETLSLGLAGLSLACRIEIAPDRNTETLIRTALVACEDGMRRETD
jgi:uroporphyrinogen-III synthase